MSKKNIDNYRPYALVFGKNAYDKFLNRNIEYYDRSWLCDKNASIHHSEKSVLNYDSCNKKWFKLTKGQKKLWSIYKKFKKI